jgi:formylglycine-generating enzyme required for sulfatase activity
MTFTLLTKLDRHDKRIPPPFATEELRRVASQLGLDVNELQQSMKGGFGSVFIAEDHGLSRRVAIKILYKDWKPERMRREIVALRTFCSNESLHSHLIAIYSCFETEHYFCYTMECADNCASAGEEYKSDSLSNRIAQRAKPPSVDEIADFYHQLLDAVEFLHSQKLVHLDIKPDNILFVKGKLKLADYSLITSIEDVIEKSCGTNGFVPPNQRHGTNGGLDGVDQDLYALGVVLHCFAENSRAWDGVSPFPRELQSQPFYKKLNRFLLKACNACESERFHNVSELRKGFDACYPQKRYWRVMLAACVVILLLLVMCGGKKMFVMSRNSEDKAVQDNHQSINIEEALEQRKSKNFVSMLLDQYEGIPQNSDVVVRSLLYKYPDAIVEKLVKKGADINATFTIPNDIQTSKNVSKIQFHPGQNVTALWLAVMQDRPKIVELLIKNGANVNWKNENGKTVNNLVRSKEIREILKSASVKTTDAISSEKLVTTVAIPEEYLYVVVDLSGGTEANDYPIRYTNSAPNLNDDKCRTTELWLRKIYPGTFIMGCPANEVGRWEVVDMPQHQVTLTQGFYIGVFECTQNQWELVMGNNPSQYIGDCRPVENVSYDMIRGTGFSLGAGWPKYGHAVDEMSFMGKLRKKTGLVFDLPTEAQWEYACRAGTTTSFNSGKNLTAKLQDFAVDEVGRYKYNKSDSKSDSSPKTEYLHHTKVGSYKPNAWGLYDMHGNVDEWCLDYWGLPTSSTEAETDPVGPETKVANHKQGMRMVRGGNSVSYAQGCDSASRLYVLPHEEHWCHGFRILCLP